MVTIGVDEVGRGCLAGPLVVGAVILSAPILGLKDSKLLSRQKREAFALVIKQQALDYSLGWVSNQEIDEIGLTAATTLAIERALKQIKLDYDDILIDGNYNYLQKSPFSRTMIKADQLVPAVSAASVLAKVARDDYMRAVSKLFPEYAFESHVGYASRLHLEKLTAFGASALHRTSYRPVSEALNLHKSSQDATCS